MHIPDGFFNAGTSLGAALTAFGGVGLAVRRAGRTLEDRHVPAAGLVAAFVFALQMLNFPVAAGTSGHVLGGVLAAVLVGPWTAAVALTVVLAVQTFFADGGITAFGLNTINVVLVATVGGYGIFAVLRRTLPRGRAGIVFAAGVSAGMSVVIAAGAFVVEYSVGGAAVAPVATVATAMLSVHALIGIGEGLITAGILSTVLAVRPDLVYALSTDTPVAEPVGRTSVGRTAA